MRYVVASILAQIKLNDLQALLSTDKQALERLISVHQEVSSHLSQRSTEDQAYEVSKICPTLFKFRPHI